MGFLQAYKMAVKSILSNKVRSLLTMLGVIIGVGAVISAVSFAQGSTKKVTDSVQGLGTNLIQIQITAGRNSSRDVTFDDLMAFSEQNGEDIAALAPRVNGNMTVKYGLFSRDTPILGTSPEYERIKNVHVQDGRFIMSFDTDYMQKVAIVGTAVINELFDENDDPLDSTIKLNGQVFKIKGILEERAGGKVKSEDDIIIIPITVAQRIMKSAAIRNFDVEAASPDGVDYVMELLNSFLLKYYKDTSSFRVYNQAQILSTLNSVTGTMMVVLGGIATISLIVGGIGIMNIMLVSVTERTREIGIRKAIGAKKKNILVQFLIEALMVTGMGGVMGILVGLSVIKFILGGMKLVPEVYSMPWILMSFGISLLVGVVFGIFPAFKAANLNPIEALRHE